VKTLFRLCVAVAITLFAVGAPIGRVEADSPPWLFVTDIHLEAGRHGRRPSSYGLDTNAALFDTALRAMHNAVPNPPVVVIGGDLLAHDMDRAHATGTAVAVAQAFNRTFPHAQFILTLGNEDSACGDYALAPNAAFLRTVAHAWAPMVNRNGAAPHFLQTFTHDGFYTARLPIQGARAVIVDNVFWSPRYRANCGQAGNITTASLDELERAVPASKMRTWLFLHIPPGIDAYSTAHLAHRLVVVPFLSPVPRARLTALISDPARNVAVVIAGHTHKFAYRIVDESGKRPVPILLVSALSPIFGNAPSFVTANVSPEGSITRVEEHSYVHRKWRDDGGLGSLGVRELSGEALRALQGRLATDPKLRQRFDDLYNGDAPPEINEANWRLYWCAATAFSSADFRTCTNQGGFSLITGRGLFVIGGAAAALVIVAAGIVVLIIRRRTQRSASGRQMLER
jgi:sphingomyelin phosphodiesterase acid-like 3